MALINCPECGKQISDKSETCINCGYSFNQPKCIKCGATYPPDVRFCPKDGGEVLQTSFNVRREPGAQPQYEQIPKNYPKAPLWSRFAAYLLDCLITVGLAIPFMIVFILIMNYPLNQRLFGDYDSRTNGKFLLLLALILYIIPLGYIVTKDGLKGGQSWGKRAAGLMVLHLPTNTPRTMGQSFTRWFVWMLISFVPAIFIIIGSLLIPSAHAMAPQGQAGQINNGFISFAPIIAIICSFIEPLMVLATSDGRRLADKAANTQVIETRFYNHKNE